MLVSILWENYKFQQWSWWRLTSLCDKNLLSLYNLQYKLYRNKAVTNSIYLYNSSFNVKCFWGKKGHNKGRYAISLYENLPVSWEYQDVTCHWAMLGAQYFLKIWTTKLLTDIPIMAFIYIPCIYYHTPWCGKQTKGHSRHCELIILIATAFVPTFYVYKKQKLLEYLLKYIITSYYNERDNLIKWYLQFCSQH